MGWASSEISNVFFPYWKSGKRCSERCLGGALPLPNPPLEGRPGVVRALLAAGARTILPDMRGFGASDKPREKTAYENSAMARDVVALIHHLRLDAVDLIGFSMEPAQPQGCSCCAHPK